MRWEFMKNNTLMSLITTLMSIVLFAGCTTSEQKVTGVPDSTQIEPGATFNGFVQLVGRTFESLTVNGAAHLQRVMVHNGAMANGNLEGDFLEVHGMLSVNGACQLEDSVVKGLLKVNGALEAKRSVFGDINISTSKMALRDSSVQSIIVKAPSNSMDNEPQVLYLNNTTVTGSITFESGKGRVVASNKTDLKGKVVGGVVEFK